MTLLHNSARQIRNQCTEEREISRILFEVWDFEHFESRTAHLISYADFGT